MATLKRTLFPALVLAAMLAPAAHAESIEVSRDTGVGLQIAAQGNEALREIRVDLIRAVHALRPTLPARPVPVSGPAVRNGTASSLAPGQRCAQ